MSTYNKTYRGHTTKRRISSSNLPSSNGTSTSKKAVTEFPTVKRSCTTFTLPVIEFVAIKNEPIDDDDDDELNQLLKEPDVPMAISKKKNSRPANVTIKDESTKSKKAVRSFGTQTPFVNLRINYSIMSDTELIYATGFERSRFNLISHTLEKYSPIPENTICVKKDSLLVTLFILRHSSNLTMAEFIFGLSRRVLSAICQDLIDKLDLLLKREDIWDKSFRESNKFRFLLESIVKYRNRKK